MIPRQCWFLVLLVALPIWGVAQNPPATNPPAAEKAAAPAVIGPAKIALVNIQQAVITCDEGKREDARVQDHIKQKNDELQKLQKELESLRTAFEVGSEKLTDIARMELAETIDTKSTALERFQQDTQKDIENRRTRWQNTIAKKMLTVIEKIAKEKNLTLVQFFDPNRDGYVDSTIVITDEVIKVYNQTFPIAAPGAPPVKK
jgi:Skp family chaperone for outer membrane proteins